MSLEKSTLFFPAGDTDRLAQELFGLELAEQIYLFKAHIALSLAGQIGPVFSSW